ncbi:MAG: type I-U CRISPR-associated protein Csx17 [Propioniciclava sp.]
MTAPRHRIELGGCGVEPLSSYLKALGVARLLHEQADPSVQIGFGSCAWIETTLDREGVLDFFVSGYSPTPIVNPWNKGSGFGTKLDTAAKAVQAIESSDDPRLADFRSAIAAARSVTARADWEELGKEERVMLMRNELPDRALGWLDAAVVFTSSSRSFPPLLGTGGNDGRLDFSSGLMQRVIDLLGVHPKALKPDSVRQLASDALFGTREGSLIKETPGQFDPGASGGPRSAPSGKADALINPWDFVLSLEGAVAFTSGVARRFGASSDTSSIPFTVRSTQVGFASSATESSRGEFWAPVWRHRAGWREVSQFLREGRLEYRGRQARSGIEAAMSLATLGVDRGIDEFVRYAFVERNGLATFAVPVARVRTSTNLTVSLLGDIEGWVDRFRGDHLPGSVEGLVQQCREAMLDVAQVPDHESAGPLLRVLNVVQQLQSAALRSTSTREAVGRSPWGLRAAAWLPVLRDDSDEFEVAVALASWRIPEQASGLIRQAVVPTWDGDPAPVDGFGRRPFNEVLGDVLAWWAMEAARRGRVNRFDVDDPGNTWGGEVQAHWCSPEAFTRLCSGELDLPRVERLLAALMLLDWRWYAHTNTTPRPVRPPEADSEHLGPLDGEADESAMIDVEARRQPSPLWRVPSWLAAVKVCFAHRPCGKRLTDRPVVASQSMARAVAAGRLRPAVEEALRTLRIAGMRPRLRREQVNPGQDTPYAIALLTPISDRAIDRLADRVTERSDEAPLGA